MFYIHQTAVISPFNNDITTIPEPQSNCLKAVEPTYTSIPPSLLRRMGKAVRMGTEVALQLLNAPHSVEGIIIGTANSGQEDCVKFLEQIIKYEEGMLTPANFVQNAPNAVAAQIGLLTKNNGYNITHVHDGLAFEMAVIDADTMIIENPSNAYLLGTVDDISEYNYTFEQKNNWYKETVISNKQLYNYNSAGTIAGEGAAMFVINGTANGAIAKMLATEVLHDEDQNNMKEVLKQFIKKHLPANEEVDLLLSGENGDNRLQKYYQACESLFGEDCTVARFKHLCGEYPTASAMACQIACTLLQQQQIPSHMIKKQGNFNGYKNILLYNNYKSMQHGFMLIGGLQ